MYVLNFLNSYKKQASFDQQIAELSHSVSSPMSFKVEYKRGSTAPAMFQRQVRFQVDISAISKQPSEPLFAITFTLLSGKWIFNLLNILAIILYLKIRIIHISFFIIFFIFYFLFISSSEKNYNDHMLLDFKLFILMNFYYIIWK